jgi:hypothetical protein
MPTLPFLTSGTLKESGGTTVSTINVSLWPADGTNTDIGREYDHEAQAPVSYYAACRVANRKITVGGIDYRIISAVEHPYLPHVALRLREMRSSGGG